MKKTLITGASGFVGKAVSVRLLDCTDRGLRIAVRDNARTCGLGPGCERISVGDIGPQTHWGAALDGVDTVVHLAARVHLMEDSSIDPKAEFRRVNTAGTLHLARQAAKTKVRRFVYLSSIKVNGEATKPGRKFAAADAPAPIDPYGISKMEAEQSLVAVAVETGLEVVIIRPPLVYGPGVKANFLRLMDAVYKGVPLPFGDVRNKRSLVALDNLVDFIITCIDHPAAGGQTFLVSDGEDLSTTELLHRIGLALGRPARLIPVPVSLLKAGAALLGRRDMAQRLCDSLQVDISKAQTLLGWKPPISVDEGLRRTANGFLHETTL